MERLGGEERGQISAIRKVALASLIGVSKEGAVRRSAALSNASALESRLAKCRLGKSLAVVS